MGEEGLEGEGQTAILGSDRVVNHAYNQQNGPAELLTGRAEVNSPGETMNSISLG